MADWVETPSGRFVNLDNVVSAEEEDNDSFRMYSDDTTKVYGGGRSYYNADAVFLRDQLRIRSSFRLRSVEDQVYKARLRGEMD